MSLWSLLDFLNNTSNSLRYWRSSVCLLVGLVLAVVIGGEIPDGPVRWGVFIGIVLAAIVLSFFWERAVRQETQPSIPRRQIRISGRMLAAIIGVVTVVWFYSIIFGFTLGKEMGSESDFWGVAAVSGPFINLVFVVISWQVYREEGFRHPFLFWGMLLFGLSPLVWIVWLLSAAS